MGALIARFGLDVIEGAAIAGNTGHESGGYRFMQEIRPSVPGSAGGLGICQWTGPRRRAYVAFCSAKGLDPYSVEAGIAFLIHELETTEKRSLEAVRRPGTLEDKVKAFENAFERSGVKAYASRNKWAHLALDAYSAKPVSVPVPPSPTAPEHRHWVEQELAPFEVKAIQKRLHDLGLGSIVGPIDGLIGPRWAAAMAALQYRAGLTVDGRYGPASKDILARGFDTSPAKDQTMPTIGKGYRTLLLNGAGVVGLAALQYVAGVDWTQVVDPKTAVLLTMGANMALRFLTTGPVGEK